MSDRAPASPASSSFDPPLPLGEEVADADLEDLVGDPETAAALFEATAPDLAPAVSLFREPDGPYGVARFTVRTRGATHRMKVGATPQAAQAVLRAARSLTSLSVVGWAAPRCLSLAPSVNGRPAVAVETRLGTTDGATAWPLLGPPGRTALLREASAALCRLHGLPGTLVPGGTVGAWRERLRRCAARHLGRLADRGDLPPNVLGAVRAALDAGIAALPGEVAVVPCHGAPSLREVAVEKRAFVGWRDLEALRLGDPWLDVAYFAFMTDGPESHVPTLVPVLSSYRQAMPFPPDLAARLGMYLLFVTLCAVSDPAFPFSAEGTALAMEAALAWGADDAVAAVK